MSWLAPWAFAGLAFLALPLAIHLLGRGRATTHDFPTLRFLPPSRLLPSRWTRIHDPLLLLLRLGILTPAVLALAQPLLLTATRRGSLRPQVARAIVLDTSRSMRGADSLAARLADSLRADATDALILPAPRPADAIAGAAAWLARRPGRTELVVISDFQRGALDDAALRSVPAQVGIALRKVGTARDSVVAVDAVVAGGVAGTRAIVDGERTTVTWRGERGEASGESDGPVRLLPGAGGPSVAVMQAAAASVPVVLPLDTSSRFLVIPADAPHGDLLAGSPTAAMARTIARLRGDPAFPAGSPWSVATPSSSGGGTLTFGTDRPVEPLATVSLLVALRRAASAAPAPEERDPAAISDVLLRGWERAPSGDAPLGAGSDASDARWGWLLVLLLLGAEAWYRRRVTAARGTDG